MIIYACASIAPSAHYTSACPSLSTCIYHHIMSLYKREKTAFLPRLFPDIRPRDFFATSASWWLIGYPYARTRIGIYLVQSSRSDGFRRSNVIRCTYRYVLLLLIKKPILIVKHIICLCVVTYAIRLLCMSLGTDVRWLSLSAGAIEPNDSLFFFFFFLLVFFLMMYQRQAWYVFSNRTIRRYWKALALQWRSRGTTPTESSRGAEKTCNWVGARCAVSVSLSSSLHWLTVRTRNGGIPQTLFCNGTRRKGGEWAIYFFFYKVTGGGEDGEEVVRFLI